MLLFTSVGAYGSAGTIGASSTAGAATSACTGAVGSDVAIFLVLFLAGSAPSLAFFFPGFAAFFLVLFLLFGASQGTSPASFYVLFLSTIITFDLPFNLANPLKR